MINILTRTFESKAPFYATGQAELLLIEECYSFGPIDRNHPRGIRYGNDWDVPKWSKMTPAQRANLDGFLIGNPRTGPIEIRLKERTFRYQDNRESFTIKNVLTTV